MPRTRSTALAVKRKRPGMAAHSACQPPTARSCSCAIADRITGTTPTARRADAIAPVASTGLCFCGMADDPPFPGAAPSDASSTSVCERSATSSAIFAIAPATTPSVAAISATRSRSVCQGRSGAGSPSSSERSSTTWRPLSPREASVPAAPPS